MVPNVKLALVCVVGFVGFAEMLTPIGTGSIRIGETVPVNVGPPVAGVYGGKVGLVCEER